MGRDKNIKENNTSNKNAGKNQADNLRQRLNKLFKNTESLPHHQEKKSPNWQQKEQQKTSSNKPPKADATMKQQSTNKPKNKTGKGKSQEQPVTPSKMEKTPNGVNGKSNSKRQKRKVKQVQNNHKPSPIPPPQKSKGATNGLKGKKRPAMGQSSSMPVHKKTKTNQELDKFNDSESDISDSDMDSADFVNNMDDDYVCDGCSDDDCIYENDSYDEEEEEENYSDYDEGDYEEEDDSYDYSDYDNDEPFFFESGSDDGDYKLPEHVPEDLIIHQGTADKRALQAEEKVEFDSDNEETQIVELTEEHVVLSVQQPKGYERAELLKLNEMKTSRKQPTVVQTQGEAASSDEDVDEVSSNNSSECPLLLPIIDDDGFQLYNPDYDSEVMSDTVSLGSSYEECSDDDSLASIDVNDKYLHPAEDSSDEDSKQKKKTIKMKADIIESGDCIYESQAKTQPHQSDGESEETAMPFYRIATNLNSKFKGHIVTAEVMDINDDSPAEAVNCSLSGGVKRSSGNSKKIANRTSHAQQTPAQPVLSIFCNAIDSNHVLVLLKDPLYVYGTVKFTLIAGSIDVYGYAPRVGEELEIFSPRGYSVVKVSPTPSPKKCKKTSEQLESELEQLESYFSRAELRKIREKYTPQTDALVVFKRNVGRKKLVNNFKKFMSENVFPNMNSIQTERPNYTSEYLLSCIVNSECDKPLRMPSEWSQLKLHANSKIMFVGGKSVGKSTLLRFLVNRHLTEFEKILLIDLDIGQPELFVPQTISCAVLSQPLLGPGFFLNRQPDKAFMIGHTNIVLCTHKYLRAVKKLLIHCHSNPEYRQLPWVINTMGYNKGFGLELIAVISEFLKPSDIVQLQSNKEINNFDVPLLPLAIAAVERNIYVGAEFRAEGGEEQSYKPDYRLHILNAAIPQESRYQKEWDMSPKDMRYAMTLARLSDALQGNAEWLTDCKPMSAPMDSLKVVNTFSNEHTRDELLKALEVNLVYLCHSDDDEAPLECFGIGVVRAVDFHLKQIYLLPALPWGLMSNVNCLALGEMPLPTSLFTNQGPKVKNVAPFVYATIDAKASKSIKQIYHRPAEFLTGKHKEDL